MTPSTVIEAGSRMASKPPRENLVRATRNIDLTRSDNANGMPTLTGHFSVFNTWARIDSAFEGLFLERIAPGAFSKTIAEGRDQMRVLFQHGQDPQIGDKVLGPIKTLREDGTGAFYEVPLLDTSYNRDLVPGIEAGLYGASFRFRVMKEEFVQKPARSEHNQDGLPERTITEAQVREFGPVTWGAYPDATSAVRSMTDEFWLAELMADPERLATLIEAYKARSLTSSSTVQPEPSGATTDTDEPRGTSEPPEATTRAPNRGLFWFAADPASKGAK